MFSFEAVAYVRSDFPTKFGVPRQSGLVEECTARVVFEPQFRDPRALMGIEQWSHLWLVWYFHKLERPDGQHRSLTVRPPRLGGNKRVGVFATRSPFRPNPIGLSCVKLLSVGHSDRDGSYLVVSGADLVDGTPILDIKPYLPLSDLRQDATGGFTDAIPKPTLTPVFPEGTADLFPPDKREALKAVLAQDPRPAYHDDPSRIYGFPFAGYEIKFRVENGCAILISALPE